MTADHANTSDGVTVQHISDALCPISDSRKWAAWITKNPDPDPFARVHVFGEVDLPAAGYTGSVQVAAAELHPTPSLRLELKLQAPDTPHPAAITPTEVRYDAPASHYRYGLITILCGDQTIAEMRDVETVR